MVLTAHICISVTLVNYRSHTRLLERIDLRCFRTILNIDSYEFVTNGDILKQADFPRILAKQLKYDLRCAGRNSGPSSTNDLPVMSTGREDPRRNATTTVSKRQSQLVLLTNNAGQTWQVDRDVRSQSIHKAVNEFEEDKRVLLRDKGSKGNA